MRKFNNSINVVGRVFNFGDGRNALSERISRAGNTYIAGDINIAVDNENVNVITVHYTYVAETNKNGQPNSIFQNLKKLLDDNKTVESVGSENAEKIRIDGEFETNDFYSERNQDFVASPRIRGGFIHTANPNQEFVASFDIDSLINKVVENDDDSATISGYVFNWRGDIMPITYRAFGNGASWFIGQDISNKNVYLGKVWGNIVNKTETTYEEEDSDVAFGSALKRPVTRSVRYWEITGANNSMEFDDESTITKNELKKALQDRQERLEADKARSEEWRRNSQRGGGSTFSNTPTASTDIDDDDDDSEFPF